MKQYKQFRAEQQHLAEIGPIGAVMMGAMGLFGMGFAGYKMYKTAKAGITGYVESRSQKKDNKKNGMDISIKVYNPASGKEELQDFYIDPKGRNPELEEMGVDIDRSVLNTDDEGISKLEKKHQLRQNKWNKETRREDRAGILSPEKQELVKKVHPVAKPEPEPTVTPEPTDDDEPDDQPTDEPTDEPTDDDDQKSAEDELRSKGDKQPDEGGIDNDKEADAYYKLVGQAPAGWESDDDGKVFRKGKKPMKREVESLLSFGEFITEDVMSDMKRASKSSKDSEIKLGDGTVIPIDKLTAQIFVKYIEGLEKSEQKKTINQIQRTERAFMKVLGQAHEG